jgi:hypothetical protein
MEKKKMAARAAGSIDWVGGSLVNWKIWSSFIVAVDRIPVKERPFRAAFRGMNTKGFSLALAPV